MTTTTRIDEEQSSGDFVFAMEEEDEGGHTKRYSGTGWNLQPPSHGSGSPRLGTVGGERGGGLKGGKEFWV